MTDPLIDAGDALAKDVALALDFINDWIVGNPPRWFDQALKDIESWTKAKTQK